LKSQIGRTLLTILLLAIIFVALRATLQSFKIEGASMEPSFHNGQYLLVNKAIYFFHAPQRGEAIVFYKEPGLAYIKRVIGLPGDVIEIKDGELYINGKLLQEPPYIPPDCYHRYMAPEKILPDHYFVLGDNRNHSSDSRRGWTVPQEDIVGKVWLCYWPPDEWGLSPSYSIAGE
jgi:signal peptidase I